MGVFYKKSKDWTLKALKGKPCEDRSTGICRALHGRRSPGHLQPTENGRGEVKLSSKVAVLLSL